jgi:A/G-specific adenine glycosylase
MTASAAELLGWDDIARRDLPWPNPGVTAWQILVSEFMLQQTPVARVQPSGSPGGASATAATRVSDVLRAWGKPGSRWRAR